MAILSDMKTWTERLGHTGLRSFTDKHHHFWLEQNPAKNSKWARLAREGHAMAGAKAVRLRWSSGGAAEETEFWKGSDWFCSMIAETKERSGAERRSRPSWAGQPGHGDLRLFRSRNFSGRHPAVLAIAPKRLWSMGPDDFRGDGQEALGSLAPGVHLVIVRSGRE